LKGRGEESLDVLAPAYEQALDTDSEWAQGEIGFWMWKVGAIDGPAEDAARPFSLQMSGDWRSAAAAWREIGCPYEVALALADGDEEAMLEAVAAFETLGAKPAADMARSRLRDMGVGKIPRGPTSETRENPMNLTARQLDVLRLMTRGLTNSEIAEALFISKKTVEHHVSAVFTKLGVADRSKAIERASELV
jgi:DNA-binding CsgD family transcriptional regulator